MFVDQKNISTFRNISTVYKRPLVASKEQLITNNMFAEELQLTSLSTSDTYFNQGLLQWQALY